MLPEVEEKVRLLVTESHLHNLHLKLVLDDWVKNHLIPKHKQEGVIQETPTQYDRAYFPTTKDLCNVAQQAIMQLRSSCFDQVHIRGHIWDQILELVKKLMQSNVHLIAFQSQIRNQCFPLTCSILLVDRAGVSWYT